LTWFGFFPSNLWRVQRINTCISSSAKLMHRFHPNKIKWELGCALETTKVVFELAKTEWSHHYIQLKKVKWWVALLHYNGFMIFKLGMLIFNLTKKKVVDQFYNNSSIFKFSAITNEYIQLLSSSFRNSHVEFVSRSQINKNVHVLAKATTFLETPSFLLMSQHLFKNLL
jgi:hypothetical protein